MYARRKVVIQSIFLILCNKVFFKVSTEFLSNFSRSQFSEQDGKMNFARVSPLNINKLCYRLSDFSYLGILDHRTFILYAVLLE